MEINMFMYYFLELKMLEKPNSYMKGYFKTVIIKLMRSEYKDPPYKPTEGYNMECMKYE